MKLSIKWFTKNMISCHSYCAGRFGATAVECGEDDDVDINQFLRYGSRFVVAVFDVPNVDWLFDIPLLPVFVGVKPLNSGDAVGAFPWIWTLVRWIEPIPLPVEATELDDAPTADVFDVFWCVEFKFGLLVDHCVRSSSTISINWSIPGVVIC